MTTQRTRNQIIMFCGLLATSLIGARSSSAAVALTLTDLLVPGAEIEVGGGLVLDQFTFSSTNNMPSSNGLLVEAYQDSFGQYGIRLSGGMTDFAGNGPSTIDLGYRVSTLGGAGLVITGAALAGNPAVLGEGVMTMAQSFAGLPTTLTIFDQNPGTTKLLDAANFPSTLSSLNVQLSVVGDAVTRGTTASFIDQTFATESDNVIPEPASVVIWLGTLTLFGMVPLTYRRWWSVAQPAPVRSASR